MAAYYLFYFHLGLLRRRLWEWQLLQSLWQRPSSVSNAFLWRFSRRWTIFNTSV